MNPFRPSLRQRVVLALAATFVIGLVLGSAVFAFARELVFRLWGSYSSPRGRECFLHIYPDTPITRTCYTPFTTAVHVWVLAALIAAALLVMWVWWLLAGSTLRPLSQTVQTVRQLGPQNLRQRVRMTGSADVLKELADALDGALDRLAAGYEGQRRFAANASHELRTPLAVQRLLAEVAMDDPEAGQDLRRLGTQLISVNERNERLIEGLLVLAESDRGLPGKVLVRLDQLAGSVLDTHQEMAAKHGVALHRSLSERLVPGDPLLLERLISNLVTNAIIYNKPGGWVEVEVAAESEPGPALAVRNTGQHIPALAVSSLFEPFRRLAADRTNHSGGAGLGMSIARSITTAHDGTIRARPRSEGGLIVEIELPAKS
jgi:signal transduction histidine kinase